jgi:hypothetical protein
VALDHGYDPRGASRRQPREIDVVTIRLIVFPMELAKLSAWRLSMFRAGIRNVIPIVALDHGYDPRGASRRQPREAQNVMNRQLDHPQHKKVIDIRGATFG